MPESYTYRMRVKENVRVTDPACQDEVVQLTLEANNCSAVTSFQTGQYIRIAIPGLQEPSPGYFAIASSPEDTDVYEFFIKKSGALSQYLCALPEGSELDIEGPMGKGFDLETHKGSDVYLIGVGTGIAPLRSVWRHIIHHRTDYGRVHIYAGFLTSLHQLLTDELENLSNHDIEVSITLEMGNDNWDGPIGYVQHALESDAPESKHAIACLAGMSVMVDACTETLQNLGFDESRILLNY
ncbi:MAG: FAD-binding oxidoreductase [Mariprofundus sp.]|nr:FAD-binding oxidoreductase [Mariprofundus sp.]